jgi:hypothetical protein
MGRYWVKVNRIKHVHFSNFMISPLLCSCGAGLSMRGLGTSTNLRLFAATIRESAFRVNAGGRTKS